MDYEGMFLDVLDVFADAQRLAYVDSDDPNRAAVEHLMAQGGRIGLFDVARVRNKKASPKPRRTAVPTSVYVERNKVRRQMLRDLDPFKYAARMARQRQLKVLAITERLKAGERPKKWGSMWLDAARIIGLDVAQKEAA